MRRCSGEEGASLVLALVVLLLASFLAVALANLTTTTLMFTSTSSAERQASYAADGAADWAINQIVNAMNEPGGQPSCSSPFPDFTPRLTVTCQAAPSNDGPVSNSGTAQPPCTFTLGSTGTSPPCTFIVTDPSAPVTYVKATASFSTGADGQVHAVVQSWVDRPGG